MKINDIFKKYKLYHLFALLVLSIVFSVLLEKLLLDKFYTNYVSDRIMILTIVFIFIGTHFIFKIKDIYGLLYKRRYIVALLLLMFVMIFQYSGSSISIFNKFVQPSIDVDNKVLGIERGIRSDEWAVNTPLIFSQNTLENKFNYFNDHLRLTNTDMFTIINAPVLDVVSIGKPFDLGYIIFGNSIGMSFWWYGRLIALLLISFELCMIIANKNKLVSVCGMLLITFSSATMWWYSNFIVDLLIFGQFAIVLIDKFMITKNNYIKYLSMFGIFICAISYIFTFYPPWQIPLGYVFLALFIWVVLKNKGEYKINKKDILVISFFIILLGLILFRYYNFSNNTIKAVMSSDYPGERLELGGSAIANMFSYTYNFLMPFKNIGNPCEHSAMLSFFPIPMIIAFIYMLKERKYKFVLPMLIISSLLFVWITFSTNVIFAKITMLFMVQPGRAVIALGLAQIYLLIYLLDNIKYKIINIKKVYLAIISLLIAVFSLKIASSRLEIGYLNYLTGSILVFALFSVIYLILNLDNIKNKNRLLYLLIGLSILNGAFVNPIIKGTSVIYEKPVSKKIQSIISKDSSNWITDNLNFPVANYLIANGVKVLNCTNYYPNFDFWNKIFTSEKEISENRYKYNRYAHMQINLTNSETILELVQADSLKLDLNYKKLLDLNIKYILTNRDLTVFNDENMKFESIYSQDGCNIFKLVY